MKKIIITVLITSMFLCGCDQDLENQRHMASGDVPVTDAIYSVENDPQSQAASASPTPKPLTTVRSRDLTSTAPQAGSKKSAARTSLRNASRSGEVLKLTEMKPVETQADLTIDSISQDINEDMADDRINKPSGRQLVPYPSDSAASIDGYDDNWIEDAPDSTVMPEPIDGATINPQNQANPLSAPLQDDKRPWRTEKVDPRLDREAKKLAREDIRRIRSTPELRKQKIVKGETQVIAGTAIQVNSEYITPEEILAGLHKPLSSLAKKSSKATFSKQAQDIIKNEVMYQIQQHLVYQQASRFLEDQAKQMIDAEIVRTMEEMRNIAGGSLEKLKAQCIREGSSLDEILQTQRRDMMVQTYLQSKFIPAIVITRQMLWNYYRKNRKKYSSNKRVQMQIIAAPFDKFRPDSSGGELTKEELDIAKRDAKSYINKVYRQLIIGGNFTRIAMEKSKGPRAKAGGTWPVMSKGNFRLAKVETAAFKLPQGRFSQVIEDESGYYIVKARKVYRGKTISFELAQEGVPNPSNTKESIPPIEDILRKKQFLKLRQKYMMDIYKKATIFVPENFYSFTTDLAAKRYYQR